MCNGQRFALVATWPGARRRLAKMTGSNRTRLTSVEFATSPPNKKMRFEDLESVDGGAKRCNEEVGLRRF